MTTPKSRRYMVTIPVTGALNLLVKAEGKEQAVKLAWAKANENVLGDPDSEVVWRSAEIFPCAFHNEICVSELEEK